MYFIIKTGYGANDFIRISNLKDLEKAQGAFVTNSKVIFENGEVCRGQDILSIKEDWHREMGWNSHYRDDNGDVVNYELGDDDWIEIKSKGVDKKYSGILAHSKERIQYLIDHNKQDLIGKLVEIPELKRISESIVDTSALANKFKI